MTPGFRTYRELEGSDRSDLAGQISRQQERVRDRLAGVSRVIGVMSGKGGVGKSLVAAALATALQRRGDRVGLLDADLHGPTAARMAGVERADPVRAGSSVRPVRSGSGVAVMSMALLLGAGTPLRWRGPDGGGHVWDGAEERRALREFLADVEWGPLDWLIVDLPPGGRRVFDLWELVPALAGLLAVTIPSEASRDSVERALRGAAERRIPILGLIENMAAYACPECGATGPLFPGAAGAVLSRRLAVRLLGRIPFDAEAAIRAEDGDLPGLLDDTAAGKALMAAAARLSVEVESR